VLASARNIALRMFFPLARITPPPDMRSISTVPAKLSAHHTTALKCDMAAMHGRLKVLKWALLHNFPWSARVPRRSGRAPGGVEVGAGAQLPECPWDEQVRAGAIWGGHTQVLAWLDEHGAPCSLFYQATQSRCEYDTGATHSTDT